jgi:hypothetical protein
MKKERKPRERRPLRTIVRICFARGSMTCAEGSDFARDDNNDEALFLQMQGCLLFQHLHVLLFPPWHKHGMSMCVHA